VTLKLNTPIYASVGMPEGVSAYGIAVYYRHRNFPTNWTRLGTYDPGEEIKIPDLFVNTPYEVAAALVDEAGNVNPEKDWVIERITPVGSTLDALPAPTNFGAVQRDDEIALSWDDVSANCPNFDHYEIREGSSWADGLKVATGNTQGFQLVPWKTDGATTYRIATIDAYGKRSAEATAALTIISLLNFVDGNEQDEDTGGFTATKTDTEVSSGKLQYARWGTPANTITINAEDWTFLPAGPAYGTYECAEVDLGSTRRVRLELDMDVDSDGDWADRNAEDWIVPAVTDGYDRNDDSSIDRTDPAEAMEWGERIAAGDESAPDVRVFIKHGATTPISGSYHPFVPGWYFCRYYRIIVYVYSWDRWRRARVSKLRVQERKKNLKDEGTEAVVSTPGPTVITFAAPFIDTPSLTAITDQAGYTVSVVSISSSSASVRVYDDTATEVFTGNIFWIAAGT